nr:MAG TPA: hypothetical protein [Caudoviricetes sp.]
MSNCLQVYQRFLYYLLLLDLTTLDMTVYLQVVDCQY